MTDPVTQSGPGSTASTTAAASAGGPDPKPWWYPDWLRHLITNDDNITVDFRRVWPIVCSVVFVALGIYSVVVNHSPFAAKDFAEGLGIISGPSVLSIGLDAFKKVTGGQ